MKYILLFLSFTFLLSCHSPEKIASPFTLDKENGKTIPAPKDFQEPQTLQLTHDGENSQGRFSYDGQRVIFQSKNRPKHSNSQIYILNFQTQKEKRVTYNDGEDSSPDFNKKGSRIIYASTTDELKEHPQPLASPPPAPAEAPPFIGKLPDSEIYESDADGSHIDRLTERSGFDAECRYFPDSQHIIFSSSREGDIDLYEMGGDGSSQRRLTTIPGYDGQGEISPDGKSILWAASRDDKEMQLFLMDRQTNKQKQLTTKPAIHWQPSWSPDGKKIFFSSNRDGENNFELYAIYSDGTCLKRLTFASGADTHPASSPDGKKILFTSNRTGVNQIYLMDFIEPKDCAPEAP